MTEPPDAFEMSVHSQNWPCTIAGWIWYCDVHDTHGNADFEEEAQATAGGHVAWWSQGLDDEDDDPCDIHITMIEPPAEQAGG